MGSYTTVEAGFPISIAEIDMVLGQITSHPGRPASSILEDRFHPKTGVKTQKAKKVPGLPAFARIVIEYGDKKFIDRLVQWDTALSRPGAPLGQQSQKEAWGILKENAKDYEYYPSVYYALVEEIAADLGCEVIWDGNWSEDFIFTTRGLNGFDHGAMKLSNFDKPEIRAQIEALKKKLQVLGFTDLEFSFCALFHE